MRRRAILLCTAFSVAGRPAVGQRPSAPEAAVSRGGGRDASAGVQPKTAKHPSRSERPLEALAQQHIMVLPVQYLTFADSLGWSEQVSSVPEYLGTLDDELTFALGERGLKGRWTFADAVTRSVKRNPGFAVDPHAISAEQVRMGVRPDDWQLHEPLASQLRSLIALSDARYVLLPVELRFTNARGGARATLHVVLIDARRSQVRWAGDVHGEPAAKVTPALAADVASRVADLIAPPR